MHGKRIDEHVCSACLHEKSILEYSCCIFEKGNVVRQGDWGRSFPVRFGNGPVQKTFKWGTSDAQVYPDIADALRGLPFLIGNAIGSLCGDEGHLRRWGSDSDVSVWRNTPIPMRENVEERMLVELVISKVVTIPPSNHKKKVSYARIPVCMMVFDPTTLQYNGQVDLTTLYRELSLFTFCGRQMSLHLHAWILFNTAGFEDKYEVMFQRMLEPVMHAIQNLPGHVIDADAKELLERLTFGDGESVRQHLSSTLQTRILSRVILMAGNREKPNFFQLLPIELRDAVSDLFFIPDDPDQNHRVAGILRGGCHYNSRTWNR